MRPSAVHFEVESEEERRRLAAGPPTQGDIPLAAVRFVPGPFTDETAASAADADVISCFVRSRVTRAGLARCPRLRLVATRSTGFDHVDLAACRERGVAVANVPRYGENTVAEHTFALILALARRLPRALQRIEAGDFRPGGLTGFDLKGKALGVVGAGSIGLHVIRIARGFGMSVLAHDAREQHLLAEVLGFEYVGLDELLARSDVVTLHVPALAATEHLIDRARLSRMKRGALLVNTARGSVVDTEALLEALEEGRLGGAGLDVIEGEERLGEDVGLLAAPGHEALLATLARDRALLRRPDVVFTPHMAFDSAEARARILDTTAANIASFLAGRPSNLVSVA